MFERAIFGGAHIEVLIKAAQILKVGLMDAEYWWAARAQWLNKAQVRARAFAELNILLHIVHIAHCIVHIELHIWAAQSTIDPHFSHLHHNNAAW